MKLQLADGCHVPICIPCREMIQEGRELARKRGHYKPDAIFKGRGGESVKVEKGATGGNRLNADYVEKNRIAKLTIVDEGEMVTFQPQKEGDKPSTKLVIGVSYEGMKDGDPNQWSMNNKSRNALIDIWGDDTQNWIGKTAEINISGEKEFKHIVVDTLRTK